MRISVFAVVLALAALVAGCGSGTDGGEAPGTPTLTGPGSDLPQGNEPVHLDPADFATTIDNRYWPMAPGSRWVYREDGENGRTQRVTVTVLRRTKKVAAGIRARVVHDVVTQGGRLIEETYDWYAQDTEGNVWYLGEDTTEHSESGRASKEGSWEAGVDGAQAGVIMPAKPRRGLRYRQEYYAGHAEDRAAIASLHGLAKVPFGRFRDVLVTRDTNRLQPRALEHKYYAAGIGPVLTVSRGGRREELLAFRRG